MDFRNSQRFQEECSFLAAALNRAPPTSFPPTPLPAAKINLSVYHDEAGCLILRTTEGFFEMHTRLKDIVEFLCTTVSSNSVAAQRPYTNKHPRRGILFDDIKDP